VPVAAEVAVVAAAAAVAAVLALPKRQTVVARPAADVVLRWILHARSFYPVQQIALTSAAIVLQAAGLVLSLCSTHWTETFRSTHGQLQKCQLHKQLFHLIKQSSRSHRSARLALLLTPGIPILPTLESLPTNPLI
jgi:ABC-type branched-subunit amino acid transport system permease subunit